MLYLVFQQLLEKDLCNIINLLKLSISSVETSQRRVTDRKPTELEGIGLKPQIKHASTPLKQSTIFETLVTLFDAQKFRSEKMCMFKILLKDNQLSYQQSEQERF